MEPLNNSFMDRVAVPIVMIARKPAPVVAVATMPSRLTPRARVCLQQDGGATLTGQCPFGRPDGVAQLRHGMTMPCASRLACHPEMALARP